MRSLGEDLKDGDVILSNHPMAGGSHLPDLTVITPVSTDSSAVTPFVGMGGWLGGGQSSYYPRAD